MLMLFKLKFHLLRHVTTQHARHVALVVRVAQCLFLYGGRRRSSIAFVYKFSSLLCSGFASSSRTTSGKKYGGDVLPTPLNTCRASRSCRAFRDERVAPCCPPRATQHVKT